MRKDEVVPEGTGTAREIDRRTVAKGVAWSVPVVIVATAAPAAAASPNPVLPTGVTLTPTNASGTIVIFFDSGTPNQSVKLNGVSGAGASWTYEATAKTTTSTATAGSQLTFTCGRGNNNNLTGTVTVDFSTSSGTTSVNWRATFAYDKSREGKTSTPSTV